MSFTPQFLDELRSRVSLAGVIGRHVRLTRRGREHIGLCPFHKEKTPSFNVVEDKGFYHCFGCGAHGDVIAFVMQMRGMGFPETVEMLAREAGLQLPERTPPESGGEPGRPDPRPNLRAMMAAASAFFAGELARPGGAMARAYLKGRGLDAEAARRFGIGFAPAGRDALKSALGQDFPESLLIEAGLLRRTEDGGVYDYFRNRIIFPIGDRGGTVIAFGGRVLGDGQPKYLNSPESPIFQKGRVLYGWAAARAACARGAPVIVTEGYMDVIALHRAGFEGAVAPLGTALTETQIEELWKLGTEPVLCFDGDAAGGRAAMRAAERVLPLLKPGTSLRFATLPAGEDPDTLIAKFGTGAMRDLLGGARPLMEILWAIECNAHPLDTPERRAHLRKRLSDRAKLIADPLVRESYQEFFKERFEERFRPRRPSGQAFRKEGASGDGRPKDFRHKDLRRPDFRTNPAPPQRPDPGQIHARRQIEVLLYGLVNHPWLLAEAEEELVGLDFPASDLDKFRREIINVLTLRPDLDAEALKRHLSEGGLTGTLESLMSPQVSMHAGFFCPSADPVTVREGWRSMIGYIHKRGEQAQREQLGRDLEANPTPETWARLRALQDPPEDEGGAEGNGIH